MAMSAAEPSTGLKSQAGKNENGDQLPGSTWPSRWKDRGKHNGEEQNRQQAGQIKAGNEKTTGNTTAKGGLLQASRLQQVTATGKTQRVNEKWWVYDGEIKKRGFIWFYIISGNL